MELKWVAIWLVVINIVVFIFQNIYPPLTDEFALVSVNVLSQPWTLVTSMFLHGSVEHILYNMIALGLFGFILERVVGPKKFLFIYFASGIIASIASTFFYAESIGASGAIFGVIGALGVLRPRMTVFVGYIPMPMIVAVGFWVVASLGGLFVPGDVAYAAHLGGLAFGLIYGFYLRKDFGEQYERKPKNRADDKELDKWESIYMRQ